MALVVGTDTYITLTEANTYWSNRNNSVWAAASDPAKEAALREATQYVDSAYTFIGEQILTNVLAWPRYNAYVTTGNLKDVFYDANTIPPQVKNACAELALSALGGRLIAVKDRGGMVKREKVDVIEIEYSDQAPAGKTYTFVAMLLKGLTVGSSTQKKLVRS
jgi:hypothetical protein